jgi:NTP pyrophosphatase (non-canonical NTP hydrolase)
MNSQQSDFEQLANTLRLFAESRDWEKFHTPKNLAMAVVGEAGELAAEFQWLTPDESERSALSKEKLEAIAMEIADVQIYLIRLADVLVAEIPNAVRKKIAINEDRY